MNLIVQKRILSPALQPRTRTVPKSRKMLFWEKTPFNGKCSKFGYEIFTNKPIRIFVASFVEIDKVEMTKPASGIPD